MNTNIKISAFKEEYKEQVIKLIVDIQTNEYNIPISRESQPDLEHIESFYQNNKGNFWIALDEYNKVIGTLGLLDINNNQAALRKMFVSTAYRGNDKQVAKQLLQTLFTWCQNQKISAVYLGTTSQFLAAQRFYEKNGFIEVQKKELPSSFPVMKVDSKFYIKTFRI